MQNSGVRVGRWDGWGRGGCWDLKQSSFIIFVPVFYTIYALYDFKCFVLTTEQAQAKPRSNLIMPVVDLKTH